MSFSSLVQDLSFRDNPNERRQMGRDNSSSISAADDRRSHVSRAMSYASTTATSVSISGDISSQLHGGYCHPLARTWQAERQLTKVRVVLCPKYFSCLLCAVYAHLPTLHLRPRRRRSPHPISPKSTPPRPQQNRSFPRAPRPQGPPVRYTLWCTNCAGCQRCSRNCCR